MARARVSAWRCALLAIASVALPARADELRSVRLFWQRAPGAESCIDEGELRARVASHLEVKLSDEQEALVIEGRIAPRAAGRGFVARIVVAGDEAGARELSVRTSDCRALDDAMMLVLGAAIDALAPLRAPDEVEIEQAPSGAAVDTGGLAGTASVASETTQPAPPGPRARRAQPKPRAAQREQPVAVPARAPALDEETPVVASSHVARTPADRSRGLRLLLGPRLSAGLMPGAAGGAALALHGPLSATLRAELGASLWPVGTRPTDRGNADFQAARLDALLCPALPITPMLHALACAGASAGALRAHGAFEDRPASSLRPLAGIVGWLFAELSLERDAAWRVRAGAGLSVELWRDRFAARDASGRQVLLHRVAPVVGLVGIELSAAL